MIRTVQTNFTSGMLDRTLQDHIDLQVYRNGARRIANCRLLPQGGVTRRPGSALIDVLDETDYQIAAFVFSDEQTYAFLFHAGGVDIWDKATRTRLTTLAGPWTLAHLDTGEMRVEQQLDRMIVSHADFETRLITRTGFSTFTIARLAWSKGGEDNEIVYMPYHKYAPPTVSMTMSSGNIGTAQATLSAAWFEPGHVGLKIRYRKKQMTVTGYSSPTVVTVHIDEKLEFTTGAGTALDFDEDFDWDEQAFSPLRGWARCFCLHLQRLWIGGGRDAPNVVWGSSLDDPFSFNLGTGADDDAIKYSIYARRVASIVSMVSNVFLQIFTSHGEFYVPKPDSNALTPSTFSIEQQSGYGSSQLQAGQFDQSTVFVTRKARGLREFAYEQLQSSFATDTLTFMSKSLLSDPIDLDTQMEGEGEEQESRAYVCNRDGTIAVLSKVRKENIAGWSYWDTEGGFGRLGVIDSEVWVTARRTVAGETRTCLEIFDIRHRMDFSLSRSGAASSTWGPFPLHVGSTVHARSGDLYLGSYEVDEAGEIFLPVAVSSIEIGLNFVPEIVPLQQHVQMPDGITMGEPKRYVSITAQLVDTLSCRIKNRELPVTLPSEDPGVAPAPYNGDFRVMLLGWSTTTLETIKSSYPLPFTLNSLVTEVEV